MLKLMWALTRSGHLGRLRLAYLRAWSRLNRPLGREAIPLNGFIGLCVAHWHYYNISRRPEKGAFGTVLPMPAQIVDRPAAARGSFSE